MSMNFAALRAPLAEGSLMDHVLPHHLFDIGSFHVTNHIMMVVIAGFLVFVVFSMVGSSAKKSPVPRGMHNFFEAILSFLRTEVFRPALGENADRFAPFLWTVFFFILFCNLLGLIPIGDVLELASAGKIRHAWGTATGGLSITCALAVLSFIVVHASGLWQQIKIKMDPSLAPHHTSDDHSQPHGHGDAFGLQGASDEASVKYEHHVGDGHDHAHGTHHSQEFHGQPFPVAIFTGIGSYIWNFAPHPDTGVGFMDLVLFLVLLVLEGIGSIVKPFSLCIRLFANMIAGHLVLAALIGLIPFALGWLWAGPIGLVVVAGCTGLSLLELFVAFLQAYIFTFLTMLFLASAVAPEH